MAEESKDDSGAPPPSSGARPVTRRLMTPFSVIAALVFLLGWIAPITYVGSAGRDIRWMPREMRHLQRVACLFTREVRSWGTYHIELRFKGSRDWIELPLEGYFDMSIFGYRTRFHRLIGKSYRRRGGAARTWYLARWIAKRYATKNPDAPKITGVRFSQGVRPVRDLIKEEGRFRKIAIKDLPPRRRRTVAVLGSRKLWSETPPRSVRPPRRRTKRKTPRNTPAKVGPQRTAPIKNPGKLPDLRIPAPKPPPGQRPAAPVKPITPPAGTAPSTPPAGTAPVAPSTPPAGKTLDGAAPKGGER